MLMVLRLFLSLGHLVLWGELCSGAFVLRRGRVVGARKLVQGALTPATASSRDCWCSFSANKKRWTSSSDDASLALSVSATDATETADFDENDISIESFEHKGCKLTYLYKPASYCGRQTSYAQQQPPLFLIHPVGIGLSSWFWEPFLNQWHNDDDDGGGPAIYAVDLMGCGKQHGAQVGDIWKNHHNDGDDLVSFLSQVTLDWVEACEALMATIRQQSKGGRGSTSRIPFFPSQIKTPTPASSFTVVAQGGLAPIGILLAARNPELVQNLILTSPPKFGELITPVSADKLRQNYQQFSTHTLTGRLAFGVLERRWAIRFFSNLFLFDQPCDDKWLDNALLEAGESTRQPVQVFNSGCCQTRSYQSEWMSLQQPILILQGTKDKRPRDDYLVAENKVCRLETINGKNVLPWESPAATVQAIRSFLVDSSTTDY